MAISRFPVPETNVSNNFVVSIGTSTNNTSSVGGIKQAGPYSVSFASADSTFDIYLLDTNGSVVGYSNTTSITASGQFDTAVILGVSANQVISFNYAGSINTPDSQGQETGAGAYLTSISPSDLPNIDDTATVIGGNFSTGVQITFESGTLVLPAKNIVRTNSTALVVTRPDGLVQDFSPYTVRAVNPGVTQPTGSNANILSGTVTAGADPTWVTTSPLNPAPRNVAFSQTLQATDADGTVVSYVITSGTITPGLSLATATGVLSGTPTTDGTYTFTVRATDDGGNTSDRSFSQTIAFAVGGSVTTSGGWQYHTFTSSGTWQNTTTLGTVEYVVIAGGGGGQNIAASPTGGGGGGAGGLVWATATNLTAAARTVTVGAGAADANGTNSIFGSLATATGGGMGGTFSSAGTAGGSGGGGGASAGSSFSGGSGTSGQGNSGGTGNANGSGGSGGGGGGRGASGSNASSNQGGAGGAGLSLGTFATAVGIIVDNGFFAGGGGGGSFSSGSGAGGTGGGGRGGASTGSDSTAGTANTGGGGGGYGLGSGSAAYRSGKAGGSGVVIVRYPI